MTKIIITVQHESHSSFDILQPQNYDNKFVLMHCDNAPRDYAYSICLAFPDEITTLEISDESVIHMHYKQRGSLPKNLFVSSPLALDAKKRLSSRRRHSDYTFIPYKQIKSFLDDATLLKDLKEKLVKKRALKQSFGMLGRSDNWSSADLRTSRGYGIVPSTHLAPEDWIEQRDLINTSDKTNPVFERDDYKICSPGGHTYEPVIALDTIDVVVREEKLDPVQFPSTLQKAQMQHRFFSPLNKRKRTDPASPKITASSKSKYSKKKLETLLADIDKTMPTETDTLQSSVKLTKEALQKVQYKKKKNGGKRICSQNSLFDNVSATQAAKELGLITTFEYNEESIDIRYEWTHLIAYEFLGALAQKRENIILATAACNTLMMHLEHVIRKLACAAHQIEISTEALLEPATALKKKFNYATKIMYTVTIDDKTTVNFEFDPLLTICPPQEVYLGIEASIQHALAETASHDVNIEEKVPASPAVALGMC